MPKGKKVKPKYKQMAFETAVRNPERYKQMLSVFKNYENRILDDNLLLDIITNMFQTGAVTSRKIQNPDGMPEDVLKKKIVEINKTRRADGGYPTGYPSRFWTYVRTLSEMGFVHAQYNSKLVLSKIARLLVSGRIDEQEAFAIQAMKYNRKSPFRNVSNDFNYFRFLVKVLLKTKNKRLTYEQFILSLFSKDGNVNEFIKLITSKKFKNQDAVFKYIKKQKLSNCKKKTILRDYPDVVIRLLRITGFVTILYKGIMFIQINELRLDFIKALMGVSVRLTDEEKIDGLKYFKKLDHDDSEFLAIVQRFKKTDEIDGIDYLKRLKAIIKLYKLKKKEIADYIVNISKTREEFKYIPDPLRLEFFISLLVAIVYGDKFKIKPNYKADSIGMPISHAPGLKGDVEVSSKDIFWLLEVTLIQNKTQQLNSETTSVIRHFKEQQEAYSKKYLSFIAPYIHEDTENYYKSQIFQLATQKGQAKIFLKPYSTKQFTDITLKQNNFSDMNKYTDDIVKEIQKSLN